MPYYLTESEERRIVQQYDREQRLPALVVMIALMLALLAVCGWLAVR